MPNLVGLTPDAALDALVKIYPASHPRTDPAFPDEGATVISQEPATGAALEPEDGDVVMHVSSGVTPTAGNDPGSEDSGSAGPHDEHHHVRVCIGHHIRVCS